NPAGHPPSAIAAASPPRPASLIAAHRNLLYSSKPRQFRRNQQIALCRKSAAGEVGDVLLGVNVVSSRPAAMLARASSFILIVALAACAERQALPTDPTGRLFARGLDEITDLYIAPVSSRKLVLSGAARLSRLDDKVSVAEAAQPE